MGFRTSRSWFPAIPLSCHPNYRALTFALAGLSPAEHTSLSWLQRRVEDWRSGRRMARYEPFPSSSLKFRTVGFPQSGFKAGLSDRTFLDVALLKPSTRP